MAYYTIMLYNYTTHNLYIMLNTSIYIWRRSRIHNMQSEFLVQFYGFSVEYTSLEIHLGIDNEIISNQIYLDMKVLNFSWIDTHCLH